MKQFNILNNQQIIDGLLMPKNCVYGHINLKYTAKIDTGKTRPIYDKNGYPVYNQDGTAKVRKVWHNEQRTQSVTYCVMDLKPHTFGNEHAFYAWIKTPGGRWHETPLVRNAWMRELNNFISHKISAHCAQSGTTLVDMFMACNATPKVNNTHEVAVAAAHRREVMRTSVYEGRWGYAVNPNIITDGVRAKDTPVKGVIATHKGAFNGMHGEEPARYDKPFVKNDYKMIGQEPSFVKFIETPSGILRFYNEREYNEYMSAQKSQKKGKKKIIIVTQAH